jgi:hypothetical protein
MTICSTASIQTSTPTHRRSGSNQGAERNTDDAVRRHDGESRRDRLPELCPTITSPPCERISAMPNGTETANVTGGEHDTGEPQRQPLATRTRVRRGSIKYVDDAVP